MNLNAIYTYSFMKLNNVYILKGDINMKVVITIEVDGNDVKISTENEKETVTSTETTIEKE